MIKTDQIQFVTDLMNNIRDRMVEEIEKDKVPENWDGIELRWWVKDRAGDSVTPDYQKRYRKRYRDYKNETMINNL